MSALQNNIVAALLALCGALVIGNTARAQLPTWRDLERAVRPQDLPPLFRMPRETPSTITEPVYTEDRYKIGVINSSGRPLRVWCLAYDPLAGRWVGSRDQHWMIKPGQRTSLRHTHQQPVVGTRYIIYAEALDGSRFTWGQKNQVHSVGAPYQTTTTDGTKIWYHTFR